MENIDDAVIPTKGDEFWQAISGNQTIREKIQQNPTFTPAKSEDLWKSKNIKEDWIDKESLLPSKGDFMMSAINDFIATIEDAQGYLITLDELLSTQVSVETDMDKVLAHETAINATIDSLKKIPKGVGKKLVLEAKNCIRNLVLKEAKLRRKFSLEELTSTEKSVSEQIKLLKMQHEETERCEKRAKELYNLYLEAKDYLKNAVDEFRRARNCVKNIENQIEIDFAVPAYQFEKMQIQKYGETSREIPFPTDANQLLQKNSPSNYSNSVLKRSLNAMQSEDSTDVEGEPYPKQIRGDRGLVLKIDEELEIPFSVLRTTLKTKCLFCEGSHNSHLCHRIETLHERLDFYKKRDLCQRCAKFHPEMAHCPNLCPRFCKWLNCLSEDHHTNLCTEADYPMTLGKASRWYKLIKDYSAYLPERSQSK